MGMKIRTSELKSFLSESERSRSNQPSSAHVPRHPPVRPRDSRVPTRPIRPGPEAATPSLTRSGASTILTAERLIGLRTTDPKYTPLLSRLLAPGFASAVTGSEPSGANRITTTNGSGSTSTPITSHSGCSDWGTAQFVDSQPLSSKSVAQRRHVKPRSTKFYRRVPEPSEGTSESANEKRPNAGYESAYPPEHSFKPRSLLRSNRSATRPNPSDAQFQTDLSGGSQQSDSSVLSTSGSQSGFVKTDHMQAMDSKTELEPAMEEVTQQYMTEDVPDNLQDRSGVDEDEQVAEEEENRAELDEDIGEEDDGEQDDEVHFTSSPITAPYSGTFHRVPHDYVNDTTETLVAIEGNPAISEDEADEEAEQDEISRPGEEPEQHNEQSRFVESKGLSTNIGHFATNDQREESTRQAFHVKGFYAEDTQDSVPVLHPKLHSISRVARTRSQPNVLRDYVNLPDASFVHWLTTTCAAAPYGMPAVGQHFGHPNPACSTFTHLPAGIGSMGNVPGSEPVTPPPPPPYRPLPPSSHPGTRFSAVPVISSGHTAFYRLPDQSDHTQFNPNSTTADTRPGQFFRTGLIRPSLYGLPSVGGARFMLSNPLSVASHASKLLTTVSSWTMHCCAQVLPHTVVCDSQTTGTTKMDEPSGGTGSQLPGSDPSPNMLPTSSELDIHALWKENQQLRHLLHEATVRLQYVDVLECHLQRLSLLVESMLASHHRQCELDQQLHGCPKSDSFNLDPRNVVPLRPMDMMMLLPHSMPANPGSLPAMPTCMSVPHYHPFPKATPPTAVCPVLPPCEHHPAGPLHYPVWNAELSCHEPYPTNVDRAPLPRRAMRPTGQAPGWPRTVSLDRADEFVAPCLIPGHTDTAFRVQSGGTDTSGREPATQKRVRVAADDAQLLPTHRQQQLRQPVPVTHLPFRSVQVSRRRFQTPFCAHPPGANVCNSTQSRARYPVPVTAAPERPQPHVTGSFVHPNVACNRPIGVSLITKHPGLGDEEAVKLLSPSNELLPIKTAVSSVYQVASACRVCLADSGDKSTQTSIFVTPQSRTDTILNGNPAVGPPSRTPVEVSSGDATRGAPVGHPIHSLTQKTLPGVGKPSTGQASRGDQTENVLGSSVRSSLEFDQILRKPTSISNHVRLTENDGSGSYEGISPSQSTEFKRQQLSRSDQAGPTNSTSVLEAPVKDDLSSRGLTNPVKSSTQPSTHPFSPATDRFVSFPLGSPCLDPRSVQSSRHASQLRLSPVQDMHVDYPSPQPLSPQLNSSLKGVELSTNLSHRWFDPVYSTAPMIGQYSNAKPTRPVSIPSGSDHHPWHDSTDVVYLPAIQPPGHRRIVSNAPQQSPEFIPDPTSPMRHVGPRLSSPPPSAAPFGRYPPRSAPYAAIGRPTLQVHFASPPPAPPTGSVPTTIHGQQLPRMGSSEGAHQGRNLTLDSIVSPHLLRRQYCFD